MWFSRKLSANFLLPVASVNLLGNCSRYSHLHMNQSFVNNMAKSLQVLRSTIICRSNYFTRARWMRQQSTAQVAVSDDRKKLTLQCEGEQERRFHGVWLRHNCRCPVCYSHDTSMSLVNYKQLIGVELTSAHVQGEQVVMDWTLQDASTHTGFLSLSWLKDNDYSLPESFAKRQQEAKPIVANSLPTILFDEVQHSDEGVFNWLKQVNYNGMSLLHGVPSYDELMKLIRKRFLHVQPSFFGETYVIEHIEDPAVKDLGYSDQELLFHQDLVYYESPPGIQLLHCVKFDDCVEGGESILLDSYPVLEELRRKHPKHFETLSTVPVTFQRVSRNAEDGACDIKIGKRHIELNRFGEITAFYWNAHHMDPLFVSEDKVEDYYNAFTTLAEMFSNSPLKIIHRLKPGEALVFNNRRMIHARNSFKLNGGLRILKGMFINIDYLRSEFQLLSHKLGKGETSKHIFSHSI